MEELTEVQLNALTVEQLRERIESERKGAFVNGDPKQGVQAGQSARVRLLARLQSRLATVEQSERTQAYARKMAEENERHRKAKRDITEMAIRCGVGPDRW
jgi:hypothetical protein